MTNAEDIQKSLADVLPFDVTLGKTAVFPASATGEPHDVVYVEVESDDLLKLNGRLQKHYPRTDTHPYVPHIVIAYLKPGMGQKYAGDDFMAGVTVPMSELIFSDSEKKRTTLALGGSQDQPDSDNQIPTESGEKMMRAPRGYTQERPLVINGKPYIGGQIIPNTELDKLTKEEKTKLESGASNQEGRTPNDDDDEQSMETSEILENIGISLSRMDERNIGHLSAAEYIDALSAVPATKKVVVLSDIKGAEDVEDVQPISDPQSVDLIIVGYDGDLIDGHHRLAGMIAGGIDQTEVIVASEDDLKAAKEFGGLQGRGSWSEEFWIKWMQARAKLADSEGKTFLPFGEKMMRAPQGYTKEKPLVINGKPYIGGQVIPNAELDKLSKKDRERLHRKGRLRPSLPEGRQDGGGQNQPQNQPEQPKQTHEQITQKLQDLSDADRRGTQRTPDPRDFANYTPPSGAEGAITQTITSLDTDKYLQPDLSEIYKEVSQKIPNLSVDEFHKTLGKLASEGKIRLLPYTRAVSDIKNPEYAFPLSGEIMYYATNRM